MVSLASWLSVALSVLVILAYEVRLVAQERRRSDATARSAHAALRSEWAALLSSQPGSEILAVQTLRNSLMSATISASTAALALMGTASLTVSSVAQDVSLFGVRQLSPRLALELVLLATLFSSYVCSTMATRYFNHAGFVMSLPIGCEPRCRRAGMADQYVRRAGLLYSWGLRCFLFVLPIVAGLVNTFAMPLAAIALIFVLRLFDLAPCADAKLEGGGRQ